MEEQPKPIEVVNALDVVRSAVAEAFRTARKRLAPSRAQFATEQRADVALRAARDATAEFIEAATPIARAFAANRSLSRELDDVARQRFLQAFRLVGGRFGD